ncbi:flagellin lysine-N-methylase [Hominiventricola aquisgranensis]|uniref:Flagellin lysine-N-methylase n=1 Tax=Hominiventricola aquisgranensis TaxID=3133164 RepID=A0ABV1HX23_9FIRM
MRYLKPHYYDKFVCTAADCPDTCCAGWQIMIDEDSLDRYGKEPGEFGKRLRNSIDWEEECFYQNNSRCAFLNDKNLCELYKELGPDALCDTCRMYPRHTEEYEGLRELSLSLSCPEAARIMLSCKDPVRFLEEETEEEDDFEEFDFMMFSQLEDTRDVLFSVIQDRKIPLTLRMAVSEQLAQSYQICMEEGQEFDIDELLRDCLRHQKEKTLQEFVTKCLSEKGVDAASFHQWEKQKEELQVLRRLERLRPTWDKVLGDADRWLYQGNEENYRQICEEFHRMYGALSDHKEEWENLGEQLLMFFVYTYFCGAVYDDMVCSKMELALFSVRWIQEFLITRWLENGKQLSMQDVEQISCWYAREIEHSDDNLNALEDWLFETYAPEGCVLEEE